MKMGKRGLDEDRYGMKGRQKRDSDQVEVTRPRLEENES